MGVKLGEFDRETQAFGLATTMGVVPTVKMAGLTLGGGWGQLHGKYGLAVDNVIGGGRGHGRRAIPEGKRQ